jgi:hypothetical protein
MAGNGGQMAGKFEAELERAEREEELAQVKAIVNVKAKATAGTRAKTSRGKTSKKAAESLRNAASIVVAENSNKLSQFLLDETFKGSITSAKLLISLVVPAKADKDKGKKRSGRSLAMNLAAEPLWQEPMTEAGAEAHAGSR